MYGRYYQLHVPSFDVYEKPASANIALKQQSRPGGYPGRLLLLLILLILICRVFERGDFIYQPLWHRRAELFRVFNYAAKLREQIPTGHDRQDQRCILKRQCDTDAAVDYCVDAEIKQRRDQYGRDTAELVPESLTSLRTAPLP